MSTAPNVQAYNQGMGHMGQQANDATAAYKNGTTGGVDPMSGLPMGWKIGGYMDSGANGSQVGGPGMNGGGAPRNFQGNGFLPIMIPANWGAGMNDHQPTPAPTPAPTPPPTQQGQNAVVQQPGVDPRAWADAQAQSSSSGQASASALWPNLQNKNQLGA